MTSPEQFNCIFCKDSFESKEELQTHFRKHGDPKFNQSIKSNASKDQKTEMGSQMEQSLKGEVVNCDVCSEVFPTISKAITHKHKMHPDHDAKYFCPWCGKLFTMKHLYNKHVQSTHDDKVNDNQSGFHCDYCEVDFFVPSAMLYHNKFFHRQDTELAAIGHSKKIKKCNEETLPIYYCPFCGEEYYNKVNLHKHMGDDHIDENQSPEEVLRCPLCEAIFYHLDAYELHLTFHSTTDLYSEENELLSQVTEFSLETVCPIMEKVENEEEEAAADASQIESFLQQALDENNDQDNSNDSGHREKKKKHKKHKKSKKEKAITLDEFLTMNTDVFGEGIDFQGVEEVPTQIVAKQLNKKTQAIKGKPGPKPLPTELAKLKKQGIIIKKNLASNQMPGVKRTNKQAGRPLSSLKDLPKINALEQDKKNVNSTPNEVLSRLLNQSNSQIKIMKKTSLDTPTSETPLPKNDHGIVREEISKVIDPAMSELETEEGDLDNKEMNDSFLETNKKLLNECETLDKSVPGVIEKELTSENVSLVPNQNGNELNDVKKNEKDSKQSSSLNDCVEDKGNNIVCMETDKKNSIVHNLGQHITIKSLSSPKKVSNVENKCEETQDDIKSDSEIDDSKNTDNCNLNGTESISNKSLNVLKHLSHLLTVKPVSKAKSPTLDNITKVDKTVEDEEHAGSPLGETFGEAIQEEGKLNENNHLPEVTSDNQKSSKIEALKNLSKHITVKTLPQTSDSPKVLDKCTQNIKRHDDENITPIRNIKNYAISQVITNTATLETKSISPKIPPKVVNKALPVSNYDNENTLTKQPCPDIVKRLPNIIAKPVNVINSSPQIQSANLQKEAKKKEVEVFNIDDSDDEQEKSQISTKTEEVHKSKQTVTSKQLACSNVEKCTEVLKTLSKNITVKPTNQSRVIRNKDLRDFTASSDEESVFNNQEDESDIAQQHGNNDTRLQNTLKRLCDVTIKSKVKNETSQMPLKDGEHNSDSDMSENVKITELPDDFSSDDDEPLLKGKYNKNVTVQEPDDNYSDHDAPSDECEDIEGQIKPNTVMKAIPNANMRPACLSNLKNVTIKSSKAKSQEQGLDDSPKKKELLANPNQNKVMSLKPYRQVKSFSQDNVYEPVSDAQKLSRSAQVPESSNQMNITNKEVTVQTFKTQTVVQEITTTVTKTIRTVNQTVHQEMRNMNASMPVRPQKNQGVRPNQQIRNVQGKAFRPGTPTGAPIIRPPNTVRPITGANIRPTNQFGTVRPGIHVSRPHNPNTTMMKRHIPAQNNNKPVVGKPLRIAPNALMQSSKRPTCEADRPFSCFKKAKESLIPEPDLPGVKDEAVEHFASSSQLSTSNYTNSTRTLKGNSVVTSTQTKAEYSASSEQISRLNSLTGLKVVKASQTKQVSKIEQTNEIDASKRSALAAIEKLKKHGLLVKKPRLEESEFSEHSNSEGDDYYDT